MLKVTIDTNVFQEHIRGQEKSKVAEELLDLAKQGKIDLTLTTRVWEDIPDGEIREKLEAYLKKGTIGISLASSSLDARPWEKGEAFPYIFFEHLLSILEGEDKAQGRGKKSIPSLNDRDHIQGHYVTKRDVFLTWDVDLLRWGERLRERFGVVSMKPEEFLEKFSEEGGRMLNWVQKLRLEGEVRNKCESVNFSKTVRETSLSEMLRRLKFIGIETDSEKLERVLEKLADEGEVLRRVGGVKSTYRVVEKKMSRRHVKIFLTSLDATECMEEIEKKTGKKPVAWKMRIPKAGVLKEDLEGYLVLSPGNAPIVFDN